MAKAPGPTRPKKGTSAPTAKRPKKVSKAKKAISAALERKFPARNLDRELANNTEVGLKVVQNHKRVREKLKALRSKKGFVPPRRDEIADRDIFKEIQRSLSKGAIVRLTAREGGLVIRRTIPIYTDQWSQIGQEDRHKSAAAHSSSPWEKVFWVPHWDHTGEMLKGMTWAMVMHEQGGRAFSLRLGPEVISAARKAKDGFARHMQQRIRRELGKRLKPLGVLAPDFFFGVEDSELGEVHLHGAVLIPGHPGAHALISAALKAAGGRWRSEARQLDLAPLATPIKWMNYVSKWRLRTERSLGSGVFAATNGLRAKSKAWYTSARNRGTPLDPVVTMLDDGMIALGA